MFNFIDVGEILIEYLEIEENFKCDPEYIHNSVLLYQEIHTHVIIRQKRKVLTYKIVFKAFGFCVSEWASSDQNITDILLTSNIVPMLPQFKAGIVNANLTTYSLMSLSPFRLILITYLN